MIKNFSVHPLFFAVGVICAFTGSFLSFISCTVLALMHEVAHAFVSERLGYKLNKIVLMPYGALVSGDIDELGISDEIKIAVAGPIFNFVFAFFVAALWWFFPETYAYTDILYTCSLSMGIINLIPAFPLDGGRVLYALISKKFGEKKAIKTCKIVSLLIFLVLICIFVYSCFTKINISILFFAFFLFGGFFKNEGCRYTKISFSVNEKIKSGLKLEYILLNEKATVKTALSHLRCDRYSVFCLYKNNEIINEVTQDELNDIFIKNGLYSTIFQ